jgi:hypothetical protein
MAVRIKSLYTAPINRLALAVSPGCAATLAKRLRSLATTEGVENRGAYLEDHTLLWVDTRMTACELLNWVSKSKGLSASAAWDRSADEVIQEVA